MQRKCKAQHRQKVETEDEHQEGVFQVIYYYTCDIENEHGIECPYPARHCKYKEQCEEFEEWVMETIYTALGDE